ncbi:MAG TPA: tRNA pseudouridine(38-40) synthase TruA [Candidatus Kapabacteria bacterium]|nr:tRNA pseudouridine(38-40) synthase TruA [Candidatus Kapabacteria bacterium]
MRVALLIEYDGTDFSGWQVQPERRTVQGELEQALNRITKLDLKLLGAGRTDTGVHSTGMVAHVDLPEDLGIEWSKLMLGVNSISGYDVVIKDMRQVPDNFNARFAAISRTYEYTLISGFSALLRNHSWQARKAPDIDLMQRCAEMLIGEHDFTSFSKATDDVNHFRCKVTLSEWQARGTRFAFRISANRFVRGQVRALTGAMVQVGLGNESVEWFKNQLNEPQEIDRAKYMAPPKGLVLTHVGYPEELGLWPEG